MTARPFLYLGNTVCKCVFTSVQRKPKLHTIRIYEQVRNFRRLKDKPKGLKIYSPNDLNKQTVHLPELWKPFIFTIMFGGTTFIAAAIWEYENIKKKTYEMFSYYKQLRIHRTGWRHEMHIWWKGLTEGDKVFIPICFLNVMVFLAWRLPMLKNIMTQYFCSNVASRTVCWPGLLSTFSHYSVLHLAANMYVLNSFSSLAVSSLGKEQFVALYLTSGVIASFTSYMYKVATGLYSSSLGASGAVMGVLGYTCTQFPDIYINIIFLPMYTFTAGMAIKAFMGFDILGCLLRLQYLDHAAHLGGVLFGMFWQAWGNANLWNKREPVLRFWRDLRGRP